jgi:hypothetical protein
MLTSLSAGQYYGKAWQNPRPYYVDRLSHVLVLSGLNVKREAPKRRASNPRPLLLLFSPTFILPWHIPHVLPVLHLNTFNR